ncbi:hypothetical protein A2662_02710 [Candidatus Giovannonibacteria bacterium RIFCSPHIGHO2_01_FULL_45_33]|uniref:Uncharacterized protein n=1 Tax=Candidatus Giovannonibacteria bacterium RIFCSPLOWO2_01_FULL_45_34 TaxID=1798351 RepID=A0A1F5X1G9_9BACT|nr:MAG: hypothetical protein A2662_02710 [Candidatus Giovannonibacteria bacterium RIFCSPHIGHO2_01_FULL_45_33]OGF70943.1 MAG: hypothetical protein A3C73_01025 [Candidatus Giovannonibacteria bacterium RIFCSPHIGHO2_02_FULL_44_11]OGF81739.1 MAG: hypothetical protein A2930_04035 [Candidatus Giovannonibacteria bacterium RIFCSPLOWO2_01_FULL_45_34]
MTLTTHAIVGAAAAKLFPQHYILAFFAGFISHFFIDAIPHWDYTLSSMKKDEQNPLNNDIVFGRSFILDLLDIGFDFFLALFLPLLIFSSNEISQSLIVLCGAVGGVSPDALQFVYFKFRREPLVSLQKFHQWIHADTKIESWKRGIPAQLAIAVFVIFISTKI